MINDPDLPVQRGRMLPGTPVQTPPGPGSAGGEPLAVRANAALPAEDVTGSFGGRRSRGEASQGLGSRRPGSPA